MQLKNADGSSAYNGSGTCGTIRQTAPGITSSTFSNIVAQGPVINAFSSCAVTTPSGGNAQGWCLPNPSPSATLPTPPGISGPGSVGTPLQPPSSASTIQFSATSPANLTLRSCSLSSPQCATTSSGAYGTTIASESNNYIGSFTFISSDPNVVYVIVSYSGGVAGFFGLKPGTATITVTDYIGNTASLNVTVQ
jgi:hypothetical protein